MGGDLGELPNSGDGLVVEVLGVARGEANPADAVNCRDLVEELRERALRSVLVEPGELVDVLP